MVEGIGLSPCRAIRVASELASVSAKFRKFELIAVQGHPRSSILVPIERLAIYIYIFYSP